MTRDLQIARDWQSSEIGTEEICKKYKVSYRKIIKIAEVAPRVPEEKDFVVIKIEREKMELLIKTLRTYAIDFEIPEKFELTEFIESSIGQ